jgi:hypothetical protein
MAKLPSLSFPLVLMDEVLKQVDLCIGKISNRNRLPQFYAKSYQKSRASYSIRLPGNYRHLVRI